jgi:hypothetical protein
LSHCPFCRALSIPDVPGTVIQATQNSCNVFVVSKRRLIMKLARYPQTSGVFFCRIYCSYAVFHFSCLTTSFCLWDINFAESNRNLRIESISHETFALSHRSLLFDNFGDDEAQSDSFSQSHSSHSASNVVSSSESSEQVASGSSGVNYAATEGSKNYDSLSSWGEDPWVASNSSEEVRYIVVRETSRCRCFASKTC